jgi:sterol desaturase/sphingolipid hydroxylase (fatty acid hydroxylase superfamily)
VLFHAAPTLWRLHRVHHADIHFDVTTGVRFHPVEILISTALKCAPVAAIGASAEESSSNFAFSLPPAAESGQPHSCRTE